MVVIANSASDFLATLRLAFGLSHIGGFLNFMFVDIELVIIGLLAIIVPNNEFGFAKSYNIMEFKFILILYCLSLVIWERS